MGAQAASAAAGGPGASLIDAVPQQQPAYPYFQQGGLPPTQVRAAEGAYARKFLAPPRAGLEGSAPLALRLTLLRGPSVPLALHLIRSRA